MSLKNFLDENAYLQTAHINTHGGFAIAIDEAGRGALYGPVTLGMLLFPLPCSWASSGELSLVADSKKLTPTCREKLLPLLESHYTTAVRHVAASFVDKYNVNRAIEYGVYRLVQPFLHAYDIRAILLDGNYQFHYPNVFCPITLPPIVTAVKGDQRFFSLAAASIVAKVKRDRLMLQAAKKFPQYGFDTHKGYATLKHREAIVHYGLLPYHRKSFLSKHLVLGSQA